MCAKAAEATGAAGLARTASSHARTPEGLRAWREGERSALSERSPETRGPSLSCTPYRRLLQPLPESDCG